MLILTLILAAAMLGNFIVSVAVIWELKLRRTPGAEECGTLAESVMALRHETDRHDAGRPPGAMPTPTYTMRRSGGDVNAHFISGHQARGICIRCHLDDKQRRRAPWRGCRPKDAETWLNGDGTPVSLTCGLCGDVGTAKSRAQADLFFSDHLESTRHKDAEKAELRAEAEKTKDALKEWRRLNREEIS